MAKGAHGVDVVPASAMEEKKWCQVWQCEDEIVNSR